MLPESHREESMKLEARGIVELFQIEMRRPLDGTVLTLNISPTNEKTWQGIVWNNDTPCHIAETGFTSTGEVVRPKFSIVNPDGTWSRYVHQKYADNAIVKRFRVLVPHLEDNLNIYQLSSWRLSKIVSLSKNLVVAELRTLLDGQTFKIPADTFRPPKYPTVSVQ